MILIVDNYDSFTYNLVQYTAALTEEEIRVYRNDKITLVEAVKLSVSRIIISPGPGRPADARISNDLIHHYSEKIPILGVCLGHQCMAEIFGGRVIRSPNLMHGKTSMIHHDGLGVFKDLPNPFSATRYHSLIVDPHSLDKRFVVSAQTRKGEVMGMRIRDTFCEGVQFHPESILTQNGQQMIKNFLSC